LSLKPTTIPPNGTESGYVFFPLGEYQKIQAVLGDTEAGGRNHSKREYHPLKKESEDSEHAVIRTGRSTRLI
jgi:hypothetical protein